MSSDIRKEQGEGLKGWDREIRILKGNPSLKVAVPQLKVGSFYGYTEEVCKIIPFTKLPGHHL